MGLGWMIAQLTLKIKRSNPAEVELCKALYFLLQAKYRILSDECTVI